MHEVHFKTGEALFREGDPSDLCFKIVSGKVDISINISGVMKRDRRETVATCGAGQIIGEMSVIDGGPRSATAIATEPTVCIAYTADEILDALQNDPKEAIAYVRTLIRRIRDGNRKMSFPASRHG